MLEKQEIYRAERSWLLSCVDHAKLHSQTLCAEVESKKNTLLAEVSQPMDDTDFKTLADKWQHFPLVFVGIGGSIFSPSLFLPFAKRTAPIDTLTAPDSASIQSLLAHAKEKQTRFIILSKSGKTAETIAIFLRLLDWTLTQKLNPAELMVAVCEEGENPLRALCEKHSIPCFSTTKNIDSRFSLWTPIGLLPATLFGLDASEVRAGAASYIADFFACVKKGDNHPLYTSAAWSLWGGQAGHNIHVMLHSDPRLTPLLAWWQQLFAESLGKNGLAMTPLSSALPEDLHIRFQLYLDGPNDKIFTLLRGVDESDTTPLNTFGESGLAWLEGRKLSDLLLGQEHNALNALARAGRPVRLLTLGDFSAHAFGQLTAHFVLEILLLAKMWGVTAFGQPAIEQGKVDLLDFMKSKANVS